VIDSIDFLCADAIEWPHEYFGALRSIDPVAWSDRHRAWVVTGHAEVLAAFRDPALSTDRLGAFTARQTPERAAALAAAVELLQGWMLFHDPPEHERLRQPFTRLFTPRAVGALEADVVAECEALLDALATGPDDVDLVPTFAHALPAAVIARLFGVPDELRPWFAEWSARFGVVVFGATRRPDYDDVARAAGEEFHEYMGALLAERRREPRDDLLSALAVGTELSDREALGACSLLLFAGHDTTASQIGTSTLALLGDPDARAAVAACGTGAGSAEGDDDETSAPRLAAAVEELLRYDGAATAMMRIVAAPTTLGSHAVQPGEAVFLNLLAANRDPAVFDEPASLVLDRQPNPHLAFGNGHHFCLGASLARLELRVALPRLLARFPALSLAGPPVWKPDISDRAAASLPVHLRSTTPP
jgi:cytochrome P450